MNKGDVLLFKNTDIIGKIVTFFTGGIYAHSAIYFGLGYILEVSPLNLTLFPLNKKSNQNYDIFTPDASYDIIQKNLLKYVGILRKIKGYSGLQILAFMFINILKRFNVKWFEGSKYEICSEFVANYLDDCGCKKDTKIRDSLMTPSDIPVYYKLIKN